MKESKRWRMLEKGREEKFKAVKALESRGFSRGIGQQ